MKGEIFDGKKYFSAQDLDNDVTKQAWEILDNGLTLELIWEALHLIEVYFALKIMSHIMLLAKFSLLQVKTNFFNPNKQRLTQEGFIQDMNIKGFFEAGKLNMPDLSLQSIEKEEKQTMKFDLLSDTATIYKRVVFCSI